MRVETEKRFEHLQIAERRFADRIRHVEEILASVRTAVQFGPPPPGDKDSPNGSPPVSTSSVGFCMAGSRMIFPA